MTERKLAVAPNDAMAVMDSVITKGDLSKLTPEERVNYYNATCSSMGLNPLTKPFDYLTLSGKTVLYATKSATDQLRQIHQVSIEIVDRQRVEDVYVVTARATTPDGRSDTEIGAVTIGNAKGDALANALMKATTKAKRRATLSICGLGWIDETEVETVPTAQRRSVDMETGEILDVDAMPDGPDPRELDFLDAIEAARSLEELASIAEQIKAVGFGDDAKKSLLGAYTKRRDALSFAANSKRKAATPPSGESETPTLMAMPPEQDPAPWYDR